MIQFKVTKKEYSESERDGTVYTVWLRLEDESGRSSGDWVPHNTDAAEFARLKVGSTYSLTEVT